MIVALIGTPSPLTYLTTNLLRAIVQVTCGEHDVIGVNTLADLRAAWPRREARRPAVIIASDMPHPDFVEFLLATKAPTVLCLERLETIVGFMTSCRGVDALSALRIATRSLSSLEPIAVDLPPGVLKMGPFAATLEQVVCDLLRFCNEIGDHDIVGATVKHLGFQGRGRIAFSQFLNKTRATLFPDLRRSFDASPEEQETHRVLARSYNEIASGRGLTQTFWPANFFLLADTPGVPASVEIELEGPARFLTHGPYFHLPVGFWTAELAIEVSQSRSQNRVGFDVFAGPVVAACAATLPPEGALACDMAFRIADPGAPVEIRMQLLSGAIEGRLRIAGLTLRRL